MEHTFKTLWSPKTEQFVLFEISPLTDEVHWYRSSIPMLFHKDTDIESLIQYSRVDMTLILPEGTEMKTVKLTFVNESIQESFETE